MERLTDQAYWEKYYTQSQTNRKQIESICSNYDAYWQMLIDQNENKGKKTLIEIGGHPGRYLAYLANKFDLTATSLDFNSDRSKIEESMAAFGVKDYHIVQADLFKHTPTEQYDIVISNGFIEHFDNFDEVLDRHIPFLKPGGTMLIMIPNKRFYKWLYQSAFDKENLSMHNLKPMRLSVFRKFCKRFNLDALALTFFGGFQFAVHKKATGGQKFIIDWHERLFGKIFNPFIKKYPNRFFSNTIIGVFKRPNL